MRGGMMACKSCGQEISRKAETCPHCGHAYVTSYLARVHKAQWGCLWVFLAAAFAIFALVVFSK
jgi:predicted RNA-binding Zn-ribbon protein involved in translation (DUF1610 family)